VALLVVLELEDADSRESVVSIDESTHGTVVRRTQEFWDEAIRHDQSEYLYYSNY
jgi:hypothetical protein